MTIKSILFYNSTIFPVFVEGWKRNQTYEQFVHPNEHCTVYSESGEWYIHKMFCSDNKEALEFWKKMVPEITYSYLGKFRSEPCYQGDYSWMEYNMFDAVHDNGMIIFVQK